METLANGGFANLVDNIKGKLSGYATQASQDAQDALIEKSWKDGVNLEPFFQEPLDSDYWVGDDGTDSNFDGVSLLGNGWAHFEKDSDAIYHDIVTRTIEGIQATEQDEPDAQTHTLLIEVDNASNVDDFSITIEEYDYRRSISQLGYIGEGNGEFSLSDFTDGKLYVPLCDSVNLEDATVLCEVYLSDFAADTEINMRLSLYEGIYTGEYVPYDYDSPSSMKHRVAELEAHDVVQDGAIERAWSEGEHANLIHGMKPDERLAPYATQLENGWWRISSSSPMRIAHTAFVDLFLEPIANGERFTLVIEIANNEIANSSSKLIITPYGDDVSPSEDIKTIDQDTTSGAYRKNLTATRDNPRMMYFAHMRLTNFKGSVDIRISAYRGHDYTGPYVPYNDFDPAIAKQRISIIETENATQDAEIAEAWRGPLEHENLTPFFSVPLTDTDYWLSDETADYETSTGDFTCVQQSDGWMKFTTSEASGANNYAQFWTAVPGEFADGEDMTMLIEARNVDGSGSISVDLDGSFFPIPVTFNVDGSYIESGTYLPALSDRKPLGVEIYPMGGNEFSGSFELRLSFYRASEGVTASTEYSEYDPGSPIATKHRVAALEESQATQGEILSLINVVSFDANSGTGTQSPVAALSGQSTTVPQCSYTYDSHTFTAWNTASDGTGTSYLPGDTITPTEDMTLYAVWQAVS